MKFPFRFQVPSIALVAFMAMRLAAQPLVAEESPAVDHGPAYGAQLEGFAYPWPVVLYRFSSQGQNLEIAYMDVKPGRPNGRVVVLLHGKNFCAATWQSTIVALVDAGYRVIAPDQIGFCKSSKPAQYQFSFQQLAGKHSCLNRIARGTPRHANRPLHRRDARNTIYLIYPSEVEQLVLVDPIGLEDWKALGVPWQSVDAWYQRELRTTAERIRTYERATYYAGTWEPTYEPWVQMLAGMYRGPGRERVAWDSALLYDMIYTRPVFYELGALRVSILLIIGDKDTTAIGKDLVTPEVRAKLCNYPVLSKGAAAQIPQAKLVEFADLGHAPQIQAPERFHKALLEGLQSLTVAPYCLECRHHVFTRNHSELEVDLEFRNGSNDG